MNLRKLALDFSGKGLKQFPKEIFEAKRLYKLNLSRNQISEIPKEIEQLQYLETLDLGTNNIRQLKAKFFNLPRLKILILNNNKIVRLPSQIEHLVELKNLQLANNSLTELPDEIGELQKLEELNLTSNNISNFPLSLSNLSTLKRIWLAQNPLTDVSIEELIKLSSLKTLYLFSSSLSKKLSSTSNLLTLASRLKGNALPYLKEFSLERTHNFNPASQEKHRTAKFMEEQKAKIFISYSHSDKEFLELAKEHLKALSFEVDFSMWEDTRLRSGDKWKDVIKKELEEATSAILLISTKFLASDFIRTNELPPLLASAEKKGISIHPVIVRHSRFLQNKSLSQFQAVNDPSKPLVDCTESERDKIMIRLCDDISARIGI